MLKKDIFDQIVDVLLPDMGDTDARRSLIEAALYNTPVLQKIRWEGAALTFTVQMTKVLDAHGEIAPRRLALVALLEELRSQVGIDRQTQIDDLIEQITSLKSGSVTRHVEHLPSSNDTVDVRGAKSALKPRKMPRTTKTSGPSLESQAVSGEDSEAVIVNTPRWPRKPPFHPRILVMKGGGVKGIAYVGALAVLEEYGYHFDHFVGTSAGAISAALLAVGYSSKQLGEILEKTNFNEFKDGRLLLSLPLLPIRKGLYHGEKFRVWLEEYLRRKFPKYGNNISIEFKHLNERDGNYGRLTIFASRKKQTAYCFDSTDPKDSDKAISFACRCSMAIPYFFMPEKIDGEWVVDGGMQNNYPIDALLKYFPTLKDSSNFIGLYLGPKQAERNSRWMLLSLFSIWSESGDEESKKYFIDRTVVIDPHPIKTTDFSLSKHDVEFLLAEGRASALHWLHNWSDKKGLLQNEVEEATRKSDDLRALVIKRRKKFWSKLVLAFVVGFACILAPIFTASYVMMRKPQDIKPIENHREKDIRENTLEGEQPNSNSEITEEPKLVFKYSEDEDKFNKNLQQWIPSSLNWIVDPGASPFGRLIKGESLGLFKTERADNQLGFNSYQDFILNFDVRFIGKKGVAWIVRAKDYNNYYLFELSPSTGPWPAEFNPYKCERGKQTLITSGYARVYNVDLQNDRDNFFIETKAIGNKFVISILPPNPLGTEFQKLAEFSEDRSTFTSGGIGFIAKGGREVLLQQLIIAYPKDQLR